MKINDKLKKEDIIILNSFKQKIYDKNKIIDENVYFEICRISAKYNVEIAIFINRKGQVLDITIGDTNSVECNVTSTRTGLNGIRVIHTHPMMSSELSPMDKSALTNNKYDFMCAVSVDKTGPIDAQVGFINDQEIDIIKVNNALFINKFGLLENITEYDKMYRNNIENGYLAANDGVKAILVKVELKRAANPKQDLEELESLAKTNNIVTVDTLSQNRIKPDGKFYIGEGKLEELKEKIQLSGANLVLFYNELTGSKINNLSRVLGIKVIDRSMLILDIFAGRARTSEGKIQIELAQLKYSLPRLNSYIQASDRFGGGVGMRGPGETALELNRRIVEKNIHVKLQELEKLKRQRELNRGSRKKNSKFVVAIVGYTNSGKSTLMNLVARENIYAKDELFATLDTTTRNVFIDDKHQILLTDTVGFIKDLPHEFIEAFASTLEESAYADLLIHVVDISNPDHENQQKITLDVLKQLGANAPMITVYNKIDKCFDLEYKNTNDNVYISSFYNKNIQDLKNAIIYQMDKISKEN